MNPFEMVVLIVAIIAVASVLKTRRLSRRNEREGLIDVTPTNPQDAGETRRLRDEVTQLKQRLQVLVDKSPY